MLKIHFSPDDLTRVKLLDSPDPLWETVLSLHQLQERNPDLLFTGWRRRTRERIGRSHRYLATLAPPVGYTADFLTPGAGFGELEAGIEELLHTPVKLLAEDTELLAASRPMPSWSADLAAGRPAARRQLGEAVREYFAETLAPHWSSITSSVRGDAAERGRTLLRGGVERLLSTLHPAARWRAPVLEVDYPVDQELHLGGRGLVLAPSFFCWRAPVTLRNPDLPPTLVYPVARQLGWDSPPSSRSLDNLLGRTRASVLAAIRTAPGVSTTELAKKLAISAAGASQHATVLRQAALVETRREGGTARHSVTTLGSALLESSLSVSDLTPCRV
ncbi:helix-turn-helix domain-containing protein [Amycolatopsis sp. YIM 10]|uniref:winged helix-turn-helix domain-containing protein n=1 Tax=Amycolatopsis sp. YIM 10 TaxID=2653857 RepID=UPI00128FE278|nr:helix-turn-helix domain-containing protein [Amycolatopsis sp. YIM 10]QFU87378.1 Helix-turn-helix domain protein [Amycolatopsis sp. YIM 10]